MTCNMCDMRVMRLIALQETHGKVMDFDAFTANQASDMQVSSTITLQHLQNCNKSCSRLSAPCATCKCTPAHPFTFFSRPFLQRIGRFESWFQGRGVLSAASLSDCPFESACKLTGSQPYTASYDTSGRSSGSVGELRSRAGGSSRAGPSSGDTLQSRVRAVYMTALKARDQQDGGASSSVALETIAVLAGMEHPAAAVYLRLLWGPAL